MRENIIDFLQNQQKNTIIQHKKHKKIKRHNIQKTIRSKKRNIQSNDNRIQELQKETKRKF